jgi:hypothetical protein
MNSLLRRLRAELFATPTDSVLSVVLISLISLAGFGVLRWALTQAQWAVVKVNSTWFHVKERGIFGGIFGIMISSGYFLATTIGAWLLRSLLLLRRLASMKALYWRVILSTDAPVPMKILPTWVTGLDSKLATSRV